MAQTVTAEMGQRVVDTHNALLRAATELRNTRVNYQVARDDFDRVHEEYRTSRAEALQNWAYFLADRDRRQVTGALEHINRWLFLYDNHRHFFPDAWRYHLDLYLSSEEWERMMEYLERGEHNLYTRVYLTQPGRDMARTEYRVENQEEHLDYVTQELEMHQEDFEKAVLEYLDAMSQPSFGGHLVARADAEVERIVTVHLGGQRY